MACSVTDVMLLWSYMCRFIGCLLDASLRVFENIIHLLDLFKQMSKGS